MYRFEIAHHEVQRFLGNDVGISPPLLPNPLSLPVTERLLPSGSKDQATCGTSGALCKNTLVLAVAEGRGVAPTLVPVKSADRTGKDTGEC